MCLRSSYVCSFLTRHHMRYARICNTQMFTHFGQLLLSFLAVAHLNHFISCTTRIRGCNVFWSHLFNLLNKMNLFKWILSFNSLFVILFFLFVCLLPPTKCRCADDSEIHTVTSVFDSNKNYSFFFFFCCNFVELGLFNLPFCECRVNKQIYSYD